MRQSGAESTIADCLVYCERVHMQLKSKGFMYSHTTLGRFLSFVSENEKDGAAQILNRSNFETPFKFNGYLVISRSRRRSLLQEGDTSKEQHCLTTNT